jgi:protein-disulfide isomerase
MAALTRLKSVLDAIAAVAMTAAAIVLIVTVARRPTVTELAAESPRGGTPANAVEDVSRQSLRMQLRGNVSRREASSSPRVALIEFADFQCPYCGKYARETLPQIKRDFVDGGRVHVEFKHLPLASHSAARAAASSAECAGQQAKFWEMHQRLFAEAAVLAMPSMIAAAREIGLDERRLQTCLPSIGLRITADAAEAARLGVQATPTFLIGDIDNAGVVNIRRRINGAYGYDTFKATLEELLNSLSEGGPLARR